MAEKSPLGQRLKLALKAAGIRTKDAAAKLGVPEQTFYKWTMGLTEPKISVLERIVRNFNINPYYILTGEGPPLLPREDKDVLAYTGKKNFPGKRKGAF